MFRVLMRDRYRHAVAVAVVTCATFATAALAPRPAVAAVYSAPTRAAVVQPVFYRRVIVRRFAYRPFFYRPFGFGPFFYHPFFYRPFAFRRFGFVHRRVFIHRGFAFRR
jgi:hypothetical protein